MNNRERGLWVMHDVALYSWFKSKHCTIKNFLKRNRPEIDRIIKKALDAGKSMR